MELPFWWSLSLHCGLALGSGAVRFGLHEATLQNSPDFSELLHWVFLFYFSVPLCFILPSDFTSINFLLISQLLAKINKWVAFGENPIKTLSLGLMILMS